jgi:hypothetical protein
MNAASRILSPTLLSVLFAAAAGAQPPSHMNQPVLEHVVLEGTVSRDGRACAWEYRGPGNPPEAHPVLVPVGRRLVITDVEWQVYGDQGAFLATDSLWVEIRLTQYPAATYRVFLSRTLPGLGQALVGESAQLTTGFPVASNTEMCALAYGVNSKPNTRLAIYNILLRGYLVGVGPLTPGPTS